MAWIAFFFCLLYLLLIVLFTPKILHLAEKITVKNMVVLGKFLDALLGIKTVKLMGIEYFMFRKWRNEFQRNLNIVTKIERTQALILSIEQSILFLGTLSMYWLGAVKVFNHEMSLGQYLAFISLFTMLQAGLGNLQLLWHNYTNLNVSIKRINDIFMQDAEVNIDQNTVISTIEKITIQNLQFKYNEKDNNLVLDNLNFAINKSEHIGIVGRNGTGKSTLVKLLVNLYPNFKGSIFLNNQEIRTINPSELRKKICLFPQDIYIYD
jgi:ATP-binding cassette subfamily B protein